MEQRLEKLLDDPFIIKKINSGWYRKLIELDRDLFAFAKRTKANMSGQDHATGRETNSLNNPYMYELI